MVTTTFSARWLTSAIIAFWFLGIVVQTGAQQIRKNTYGTNGEVRATATNGSSVFVGGNFTQVFKRTGSGYLADAITGQPVQTLPSVTLGNNPGTINTMVADGSGGWFIAGNFDQVAGVSRSNLAHLTATYQLDPAFVANTDGEVFDLALLSGNLYVAGSFSQINNNSRPRLAQVSASSGSLTAWTPATPDATVRKLQLVGNELFSAGDYTYLGSTAQNAGPISTTTALLSSAMATVIGTVYATETDGNNGWYIGGEITTVAGLSIGNLAHINADGSLDQSFSPSPNGSVRALKRNGTNLFVGGSFTEIAGRTNPYLAIFSTTTHALDLAWAANSPNAPILTIESSGNKVWIGGSFTQIGVNNPNLATLNRSSNQVVAGLAVNGPISTTEQDGQGGYYVGGSFSRIGGVDKSHLVRVTAAGQVDLAFNPTLNGAVTSIKLHQGKLYVAGTFTTNSGADCNNIIALNPTTGAYANWQSAAIRSSYLRATPSNKNHLTTAGSRLFVSGDFDLIGQKTGGLSGFNNSTGKLLSTLPSITGTANAIVSDGNGGYYIGGNFSKVGSVTVQHLTHLNPDGTVDNSFSPSPDAPVRALVLKAGVLYIGGDFTSILSQTRIGGAAINVSTNSLTAWNPNISVGGNIQQLVDGGTTLYAVGTFSQIDGVNRNGLAAISLTLGTATSWDPEVTGTVRSVLLSGSQLYVAGSFSAIGGQTRTNLARISTSTALTDSWDVGTINGDVNSLAINGTTLLIGGNFSDIASTPAAYLASLSTSTAAVLNGFESLGLNAQVTSLAHTSGKLMVGGHFSMAAGSKQNGSVVLSTTTNLPLSSFDFATDAPSNQWLVDGQKILAVGDFSYAGYARANLMSLSLNTNLINDQVSSFRTRPSHTITAVRLLSANQLAVAGYFTSINGSTTTPYLAKLDTATATLISWPVPELNGPVEDLALIGTNLYATGSFNTAGGSPVGQVLRLDQSSGIIDNLDLNVQGISSLHTTGDTLWISGAFSSVAHAGNNNDLPNIFAYKTSTNTLLDAIRLNPSGIVASVVKNSKLLVFAGSFGGLGSTARAYLADFRINTASLGSFSRDINGTVMALQYRNGHLYAGGTFNTIEGEARYGFARFRSHDNQLSPFTPLQSTDGVAHVSAITFLGSKLILGGSFATVGVLARPNLASIDSTTALADNWAPMPDQAVLSLHANGTNLYVGGQFGNIAGARRTGMAAFAGTSLVSTFNPECTNSFGTIYSISAGASAGSIFVGGNVGTFGGINSPYLAYHGSTTNLLGLRPKPNGLVHALSTDGSRLFVGGAFNNISGQTRYNVSAYTVSSGALTTFNDDAHEIFNASNRGSGVRAMAVAAGSIYVGGYFYGVGGDKNNLVKVNFASSALQAWAPNPDFTVNGISTIGTSIYALGGFSNIGGQSRSTLASVDATTGLATTFISVSDGIITGIGASGSQLMVHGTFGKGGVTNRNYAAAFSLDGTTLLPWNPAPDNHVNTLAANSTTVAVGGYFSNLAGNSSTYLGAVSATGTGNSLVWSGNLAGAITSMLAIGSDLYVGGSFGTINNVSKPNLALLNLNTGVVNATFSPNPNQQISALATNGSQLFAAGPFSNIGGLARSGLASLSLSNGTATAGFNAGTVSSPLSLSVLGSNIYVGTNNGITGYVASIGASLGFAPATDNLVNSLGSVGGVLCAGGTFNSLGGNAVRGFGKFNNAPSSTATTPLNLNTNGVAYQLLPLDASTLLVGGTFTSIASTLADNIAICEPGTVVAPTILSFSPAAAGAGQTVTITGENLLSVASVIFGGTQAASFTVRSATELVATIGAGSSGSVTLGNGAGSSSLSGFTFCTIPTPTISNSGSNQLCLGQSVTLTASSGSAYLWSTGATTQSITVTRAGNYTVRTISGACTSAASALTMITIGRVPGQTYNLSTIGQYLLDGNTQDGSAVANHAIIRGSLVYQSTPSTNNQGLVLDGLSANYLEIPYNSAQNPSTNSFSLHLTLLPDLAHLSGLRSVYQQDNILIQISSTNLYANVTTSTGNATIYVSNPAPTATTLHLSLVADDDADKLYLYQNGILVGEVAYTGQLTFSNVATFIGRESGFTAGIRGTLDAFRKFNYALSVPEITYLSNPNEAVLASSNSPVNPGQTLQLTAATVAGATYSWTGPNGFVSTDQNPSIPTVTTVAAGTYSLTISINGCIAAPIQTVVVVAASAPTITNFTPTAATTGQTITITGTNLTGTTAVSFGGTLATSFNVQNATTITSVVGSGSTGSVSLISPGGNASLAGFTFCNLAQPTISASGPSTICEGEIVTLTASASPGGHLWSTGETTNSIIVSTTASITLRHTDGVCTSAPSATQTITVRTKPAKPTITIIGNAELCNASTVTLSAPAGYAHYRWSNNATTQSIVVNSTNAYSVEVADANLCYSQASDAAIVTNITPTTPFINVLGGQTAACLGDTLYLEGPAGYDTYLWTGTTSPITNRSILKVTTTSPSIRLQVGQAGCTSSQSTPQALTFYTKPTKPTITNLSVRTDLCGGGSIELRASAAAIGESYVWSDNNNSQTISVTIAGKYALRILNGTCFSATSDTITITDSPALPTLSISPSNPADICEGDSVLLTATTGHQYLWSNGKTSQSIWAKTNGIYTVSATGNNCVGTPSTAVYVNYKATPSPPYLLNITDSICIGQSVIISPEAPPVGMQYLWQGTTLGNTYTVNTAGTYFAQLVLDGCLSAKTYFTLYQKAPVNPVTTPNIVLPANNTLNIRGEDLVISWAPQAQARGYRIYIYRSTETRPATPIVVLFDPNNVNYPVPTNVGLPLGELLRADIVAYNGCFEASASVQFSIGQRANLVVTSITHLPTFDANKTATITYTVKNIGAGSTNTIGWEENIWLNVDKIDLRLANTATSATFFLKKLGNTQALLPGQSYTRTVTVDIPEDAAGSYYIWVLANRSVAFCGAAAVGDTCPVNYNYSYSPLIEEDDIAKRNNIRQSQVFVNAQPRAALQAQQVQGLPAQVFAGSPINLKYTVKNIGIYQAVGRANEPYRVGTTTSITSGGTPITIPLYCDDRYWTDKLYISKLPSFNIDSADLVSTQTIKPRMFKAPVSCYTSFNPPVINNQYDPLTQSIHPDSVYVQPVQLTVPENITGTYYLFIHTNDNGSVLTNPAFYPIERFGPFQILINPYADLVVNNITLPDTLVSATKPVGSYRTRNQGFVATTTGVIDSLYFCRAANLTAQSIAFGYKLYQPESFSINQSRTNALDISIPDTAYGRYYIFVKTNLTKTVFEHTATANNAYQRPTPIWIKKGAFPDLRLTSLFAPDSVEAGSSFQLNYGYRNIGLGYALPRYTDSIKIVNIADPNNSSLLTILTPPYTIDTLRPQQTATISQAVPVDITQEVGTFWLRVNVNGDRKVSEDGRYANNTNISGPLVKRIKVIQAGSTRIDPNATFDWQLNSLTTIGPVTTRRPMSIQASYRFNGPSTPTTPPYIAYSIASDPAGQNTVLPLGYGQVPEIGIRGQSATLSTSSYPVDNIGAGNYYLVGTISNFPNDKFDGNLANNTHILPITILSTPAPDLVLSIISCPTTVFGGRRFKVKYRITNQGNASTTIDGVNDHLTLIVAQGLGGERWTQTSSRQLSIGESYVDSMSVAFASAARGLYLLTAKCNADPFIFEPDLANNISDERAITVIEAPKTDLLPLSIKAPTNLKPGRDTTISVQLRNDGPEVAEGDLSNFLQLRLPAETNSGFNTTQSQYVSINPGQTHTAHIRMVGPGAAEANNHVFDALVNATRAIPETNYDNDSITQRPISISYPMATPAKILKLDSVGGFSTNPWYFKVSPPAGTDVLIELGQVQLTPGMVLDSINHPIQLNILGACATAWPAGKYILQRSTDDPAETRTSHSVIIPNASCASYIVSAYRQKVLGDVLPSSGHLNVKVTYVPYSIKSVSPTKVGQGPITLLVNGGRFEPNMTWQLESMGGAPVATSHYNQLRHSMQAIVRFNLLTVPLGQYRLVAINAASQRALFATITVDTAITAGIRVSPIAPAEIRKGRSGTYRLSILNDGNVDAEALQVQVVSPNFFAYINDAKVISGSAKLLMDTRIPGKYEPVNNQLNTDTLAILPIWVRNLRPGEKTEIEFKANILASSKYPGFPIYLTVNKYSGWRFARHFYRQMGLVYKVLQKDLSTYGPAKLPTYPPYSFVKTNPDKRKFIDTFLHQYFQGGVLLATDTAGIDPYNDFSLGLDSLALLAPLRAAFPPMTRLFVGDPANYHDLGYRPTDKDSLMVYLLQKAGCRTCGYALGFSEDVQERGRDRILRDAVCEGLLGPAINTYSGFLENAVKGFTGYITRIGGQSIFNAVAKETFNPAALLGFAAQLGNAVAGAALGNHPVAKCWAQGFFTYVNSAVGIVGEVEGITAAFAGEGLTVGASSVGVAYYSTVLAKDAAIMALLVTTRINYCNQISNDLLSTAERDAIIARNEATIKSLTDNEGSLVAVALNNVSNLTICAPTPTSRDPNDIKGLDGYGPNKFVSTAQELKYRIRFENDSAFASAAAQRVYIKTKLPKHVSANSIQLGNVGFDRMDFTTAAGQLTYSGDLPVTGRDYKVHVTAGLDISNNQIIWEFQTLDPVTNAIPASSAIGMLPVNDSTGTGEGYVDFSILVDPDAATGDTVAFQADIYFDDNEVIRTNTWVNMLDAVGPTVTLRPLDPIVSNPVNIRTQIASDDFGGSGLDYYKVWVAEGNQPYAPLDGVTPPTFTGTIGATYRLAVAGRDFVGNGADPDFNNPTIITITGTKALAFTDIADTIKLCQGQILRAGWAGLNVDTATIGIGLLGGGQYLLMDTLLTDSVTRWQMPTTLAAGLYNLRLRSISDSNTQALSPFPVRIYAIPTATIDTMQGSSRCAETAGIGLKARLIQPQTGVTYRWTLPDNTVRTTDSIFSTQLGVHLLVTTNPFGCQDTTFVTLRLNAAPLAPLISGPTSACTNSPFRYAISGLPTNTLVRWYVGSITSIPAQLGTDTSFILTPTASTTILARYQAPNKCLSDTGTLAITTILTASKPAITYSAGTTICLGDTITLSAPAGMAQYRWSNGDTTQTIRVFAAGKFAVRANTQLTNPSCFSVTSDTVQISIGNCNLSWTGTASADWHNVLNWQPRRIPTSTDTVLIGAASSTNPVINTPATVGSINISGVRSLTLNANLTISKHLRGANTVFLGSGYVVFGGTSKQFILGNTNFRNLELDNSAGLELRAAITYAGTLKLTNGILNANGQAVTALSNSAGTAEMASLGTNAAIQNAQNFTFQRWYDPTIADANGAWMMTGSPVLSTTVNAWSTNNPYAANTFDYTRLSNSSVWLYSPTSNLYPRNQGYVKPSGASQQLLTGQGARIWLRRTPFYSQATPRISLTGTPRTGNQTFAGLSYCGPSAGCPYTAAQGGAADNGWNLLSNPYPATLDWDATGWTKNQLNGAIYIYRHNLGQYCVYNGGVGTFGATNLIAPGQGFFVQATSNAVSLMASESCKAIGSSGVLKAKPTSPDTGQVMRIRISQGNKIAETIYRTHTEASTQFDPTLDAYALSPDTGMAMLAIGDDQGGNLAIKSQPSGQICDTIQLVTANLNTGLASVQLRQLTPWMRDNHLTLIDKVTGAQQVITQDTSLALAFRSNSQDKHRYALVIRTRTTNLAGQAIGLRCSITPNPALGWFRFLATDHGTYNITMLDAIGKVVAHYRVSNNSRQDLSGISSGLYFLQLPDGTTKRLVVQ